MTVNRQDDDKSANRGEPFELRIPGLLLEHDLGLGDAIKQVTYRMGATPCSGCDRRASALNRWVVFSRGE